MSSTDRNAPCPCGSTKKYKHCCLKKETAKTAKPSQPSAMASVLYQVAVQNMQAGRLQQAKLSFEQVLQANPKHAESLQWLGVITFQLGNRALAIELIERAIAINPDSPVSHATLANMLQATGQTEAAIKSYGRALALKPNFAEAHNNLGNAYASKGQLLEAANSYQSAITLQPKYAEAYNNLGAALQGSGLPDAAADAYKRAIELRPNYAQALCNLAASLKERSPDEAEKYVRQALSVDPNHYEAWVILGKILQPQGHPELARQAIARAQALRHSNGLVVFSALVLPTILGTQEEIQESRNQFQANLERLAAMNISLHDPVKELCETNFQLAYQARNDRDLQQKVASFYLQACPSLNYVAKHCLAPLNQQHKSKRIGFFSRYISNHSVALSYSRLIEKMACDPSFETVLISSHDPQKTSIQETYPNFAGEYLRITLDLSVAREQIANLNLDILVYLDIGMDPFSYFLAFSRLAKTQCVFDGHPVTTGIPAMDYFLSVDLAEPDNAQEHYSEKLERFHFGAYSFERSKIPQRFKSRQELGLPLSANIYTCPMVLVKIHPDFDEAITQILQLDPQANVIFFEDKKYASWRTLLESRFDKTIAPAVRDRIVFLPWIVDPMDFMSVIEQSNVILDPYHFGLGTTAIATCTVGTPFVTKPGEFVRGRYGYYYSRLLDAMECVATDTEDYVKKAVQLATNEDLRAQIKAKILANNRALFGNYQGIDEVKSFFQRVSAQA